jgi:DNA-binding beta-propeller fold protein YncE
MANARRWPAVAVAAVALAGCSTGTPAAPPPLPPAAEPATAPPVTVPPAGRVVPVGASPEGAVADPVTHVVAVGTREPDALTLVDGNTGRVLNRVPLPGHLRHLQLAAPGGPVLVPDETANSLLTVTVPDGRISGRVPTGVSPHDATSAANGVVFVANELGGTLSAVRDGRVVRTFTEQTQPGGLAAVGDLVGQIDVRQNDLSIYDAAKLERVARVPAGNGPTHVLADRHGRLVVADTRGNGLLLFRLAPQTGQESRLDLPGTPYGLAYDPVRDRIWVTLTAANEVVGIDASGPRPAVVARFPTVRQPNTVAVDSTNGRLSVTGTDDGVLQLIDP